MDSQLNIAIAIWDGVEELDFAGPYEVLTAWSRATERPISVFTVSHGAEPVTCAHGLRVIPDRTWDELERPDIVVLPGGGTAAPLGVAGFTDRLRKDADAGTLMTSVCTGAFLLAEAGLLDGKPATTHWSALESLATRGKDIEVLPDARYVDNCNVITAAGVSAGIDMALYRIKRLDSDERAREVRRYIQYDPQPPV
jgi:transcriptional regulator GlxA family with amidase domain